MTRSAILVLNAGSSSLKYQLLGPEGQTYTSGLIERIGEPGGEPDHAAALRRVLSGLPQDVQMEAVGHRVVHGGERFTQATRITPEVLATIDELSDLAPLHNPPAVQGIRAALGGLPGVPNVAVFDTAFHTTLPPQAYLYAVPHDLYRNFGVRRYGFHGTSHAYVSRRAAELLGGPQSPEAQKIVTLHLGNGASAAAVLRGQSVDTSMGLTPLEGLVMGTRSGDLDPGAVLWLTEKFGLEETTRLLNRQSGLKGLSGVSNDLRDVRAAQSERAELALAVMTYRLIKQVGAYAAAMNGLGALVFTGGAGENDAKLRADVLQGLTFLGFELDEAANGQRSGERRITTAESKPALVIPTDEEGEIARQTRQVLTADRAG
ncbi:acetate kinase [Deinococcus irradiatisoli]|uniref:Acetate kinase n=1 Tax=Deinococcus irradiatisoli TaxID=2202254 RepID=A0A2Z3JQA9_9DEIO|nr:acetate kinase [Deinococcus irradiatisoli]AWN23164.1 acetate kinase [Deinococcus irradiatisoli]